MRVAVIGSRTITVEHLGDYIPGGVTVLLSGGAKGVDASAREYAESHGLELRECLPEYTLYGRAAPCKRNRTIVEQVDLVLAFWDGRSKGTRNVIQLCEKLGVPVRVYRWTGSGDFRLESCETQPRKTTNPCP